MSGSLLGARTTVEVGADPDRLLLAVPLGACEQHGPHLPLWTDSLTASHLCARLATARSDVVVAPLVGVGASGEHASFAGTLSVGTEVLAAYCIELTRSARPWSRGVVFVSGHGGNVDALREVARQAVTEGDDVVTFLPSLQGADAHAGRAETSIVLAVAAEQVRQDDAVVGITSSLEVLEPLLRAHGVAAVSPSGVLGDPTGASEAEGRRHLDALVDELLASVAARFGDPR